MCTVLDKVENKGREEGLAQGKLEGIYRKDIYELPPGGHMPGVTLDKMKEGYSKIRNRAPAHAFSYMNLIEAWGSGIPKLMEVM